MTRRRRHALIAAFAGPPLCFVALAWTVYAHFRIEVPPRLSGEARAEAMVALRGALEQGAVRAPAHPELALRLPAGGPAVVTVWHRGSAVVRVEERGATAAEALAAAARALAGDPALRALAPDDAVEARIKVDLVVGRGPILERFSRARSLSLHPGLEGLGVILDGEREVLLLAEDLVDRRLLLAERPLDFVPDFYLGLDFDRADASFAQVAALPTGGYGRAERRYFRFRADSFVERPAASRADGPPLALTRGQPPAPEPDAHTLREAALAGGRYLVAHLAPSGRYVYEVDLATGRSSDPTVPVPYSLPRHAGTTYFLAELYRFTGEEFLREPIERAFSHLVELVHEGGCRGTLPGGAEFSCVLDRGERVASLGSAALTVVALAEYRRATGDPRYDPLARELTEWILHMQRPDGSFAHLYNVAARSRDEETELLYFSGEAALALARMHEIHGDRRYLDGAERGLDWLVRWYDFFLGGFFYGEEHWTCIAAEAAWPALRHARYRRFCDGYAAFLRAQQPGPGEFPDHSDLAGAYTFTPLPVPANTPAGSRTEAVLSAYLLGRHHGASSPAIRTQILEALRYSLGQQVRADNDWSVGADSAHGGIPGSPVDRVVRIDYVQHVASAMIRAASILEKDEVGGSSGR